MAKKPTEPKIVLEREYIVPLRHGWLKVPVHKRAMKAVKTLKEFLVQHMKVYDRDLRKIKLNVDLNNEIRFKGMRKPLAKIKVKAAKDDTGIVRVDLVDVPEKIKFKRLRALKKLTDAKNKVEKTGPGSKVPVEPKAEPKKEESKDVKEKEAAGKEETEKLAKQDAKEQEHVSKDKKANEIIENRKKRSQSGH